MSGYPVQWESDVVLTDGRTVHLRPIRREDASGLYDLWSRLSDESIYLRFFSPMPRPSERQLEMLATVDYVDRMALVAELGSRLLGVARYDRRVNVVDAEVAFVVADAHQGRGIGTALLEHLAAAGRAAGVHRFVAKTLPENQRMLGVFRDAGWNVESEFGDGVVAISFPIEPTGASRAVADAREQVAEVESVRRLLQPRSVAVISSGEVGAIGGQILRGVLAAGFRGPVYPVESNPAPGDQRPYTTIVHVPERIDLAVVAVDPSSLHPVVEDCARMGVAALMVVTGDLPAPSPVGSRARPGTVPELVGFARRNGMRLIGPGAQGLLNTDPYVRLNATVHVRLPDSGGVSLATQEGGVATRELRGEGKAGHRLHEWGVRNWVALGSKADVSGNDLLSYWESDDDTTAIALSLASFGNPRHFVRTVRRVARTKPVVAAYPEQRPDDGTLLGQLGVIRVDSCDELIDAVLRVQDTANAQSSGIAQRRGTTSASGDAVTARIAEYRSWCARPVGEVPPFDDMDLSVVQDLATSFLDRNDEGGLLSPEQALQVCRAIGVSTLRTRRVLTADEAVVVAADVGYPVAMKAASETLDYRDRTAWLHLDLRDNAAVRTAFDTLDASLGEDMGGALLQPMAASGVPTAVVARRDERFDAVLTLHGGLGGRRGTGPRVVHILPLSDTDAAHLVETAAPTVFGADATPPGADRALTEVLLRVAKVSAELPEVVELALDPLVLTPDGAQALDVNVRVASARVGPPPDVRHLA